MTNRRCENRQPC